MSSIGTNNKKNKPFIQIPEMYKFPVPFTEHL